MTDPEGPGDPQPQGEKDDKPELDIDAAFAAIIADFGEPVPHGVGPWPASEDLDDELDDPRSGEVSPSARHGADDDAGPGRGAPEAGPTAGPAVGPTALTSPEHWDPPVRRISLPGDPGTRPDPATGGDGAGDATGRGGRSGPDRHDDEDDEGYQPPEPPPFPRGDSVSRAGWAAVIGGPVFLLVAALLWRSLPTVLLLAALTAFVGGFVTLVARMPQEHPDDPDDGAVV